MQKKKVLLQTGVILGMSLLVLGGFVLFQKSSCDGTLGLGCESFAQDGESEKVVQEILDLTAAPEEYDSEYTQARAAVERDIERREQEARENGRDAEASLQRATQKALELRESQNNLEGEIQESQ